MPNNQFVLGYYSKTPLHAESVAARARGAHEYAESLHRRACIQQFAATGPHTGLLTWMPCNDTVAWPQFASAADAAVAWVGIPEHDAMSDNPVNALDLGRQATRSGFNVDELGAPYACLFREGDEIRLVNDSLGMARFYEFDFGGIVVWATRPGLAHIFAAESAGKDETAWSGMATLGWNAGGHSHIGAGVQLGGRTRITASGDLGLVKEDRYAEWVHGAPEKGASWTDASTGMVRTMSLGRYFSNLPIADLSGGKDSRLLAAAALTSGVTDKVRTVRSDYGEVETAQRLVELYPGEITHIVTDVSAPRVESLDSDLVPHVAVTMRGSEGATVASTALRGPAFSGYVPLTIARFNGHGGEALHGGEYCGGAWKEKLAGKSLGAALDRMVAMVMVARGVSDVGRERTVEVVRQRLDSGLAMGIDSAYGLLNYFYSSERMALWASSSPNRAVITPYYSSGLLHHIARTFTEETHFERFYFDILNSLVPQWSEVPFYRPVGGARRASKFFWENFHWPTMRDYVIARADSSSNFAADGVRSLVEAVGAGDWTKRVEVSLSRFIWEASVDSVLEDVNHRVSRVRAQI